jgi:hypothetical protein
MEAGKKVITRRDFIRVGSCLTMGSLMGLPLIGSVSAKKSEKSRVVLIRDKNVLDSRGQLSESVLQNMLDKAVTALMDTPDPVSAWKQLVTPADIVGIKTNVWHYLPTPEPLEVAIWNRLLDAGVKKENISADDRGVRQDSVFKRSTYSKTTSCLSLTPICTTAIPAKSSALSGNCPMWWGKHG